MILIVCLITKLKQMNTKHIYSAGLLLIIGVTSCTNAGTTPGAAATTNPGDSTVTTTTTTTSYHRKYAGSFTPQATTKYIDLKTNKEITVRIDTVRGSIVNDQTNEPVDLFVEPRTHDTIYGQTGSVVNNYIIHDPSGDVRVDTIRINTATPATTPDMDASGTGKVKYKENARGTKSKYKDDEEKVKEKNGVEKIKER